MYALDDKLTYEMDEWNLWMNDGWLFDEDFGWMNFEWMIIVEWMIMNALDEKSGKMDELRVYGWT